MPTANTENISRQQQRINNSDQEETLQLIKQQPVSSSLKEWKLSSLVYYNKMVILFRGNIGMVWLSVKKISYLFNIYFTYKHMSFRFVC